MTAGFKASYFADLARLEEWHFWFRCRNRLILWALKKYCSKFTSMLEIGCGTGYVLSGVTKVFPGAELYGGEIYPEGLVFAAARMPAATLTQMDARHIPFANKFDVVGAFDVLEHIQEDGQVLTQIHQALKPQGFALLTVPQHDWLWSHVDDYSCHVRRYSAKEIHAKTKAAGFEIVRSTSFVSSLLPAMFISRLMKKGGSVKKTGPMDETRIPSWLNSLGEKILNAETLLIRGGMNFPAGGSRLVVARKI